MTAYITKYALTQGIIEVEAKVVQTDHGVDNIVSFSLPGFCSQYCSKPDWHTDRIAALTKAELMRLKAISNLNKKLRKLEQLTFS